MQQTPVVAELEAALAMRHSGADAKLTSWSPRAVLLPATMPGSR
jgi:hypothetical protein